VEAIERRIAPLLDGRERSARFEKRYVRKDGTTLWADASVTVRRDDGGRPLHFITTIVDISERKRAEEALRASEEYQRAMIACSPVALYSVDADGVVLTWNHSAERVFGWRAEEVVGRPLPIVPDGMREEFAALRERALDDEGFVAEELVRQRKDGALIPVRLSVAPVFDSEGSVIAILGAAEDISERLRAEAEREELQGQLLQSQKLQSVGRLAGGVAHDFNNMLGVIIGRAEMRLRQLGPDDADRSTLEAILNAANRSADLTRQLLAFARQQTIAPKVLGLNETVEGLLKMIRRLIGEDIDLAWQPARSRCPVYLDPSQVDQILVNLCVNARDAIDDVGKITIETALVSLSEEYCAIHVDAMPGEYVLLAVSDDGCGMDTATRAQVFEPFFTTKESGMGTGLGLSTVFGIVRQNDGFINVYSEPGQGSTFRIYLPCHLEDVAGLSPHTVDEAPGGRGERALLVEDEPSLLEMIQTVLEELGYSVVVASGPSQALEAAAEQQDHSLDLLVTDVVMPGMNGKELAERLRAELPDMKVLFMSGYTSNAIAHHGVLDTGVHFIQKPFSMHELAVKVREALRSDQS
jgi:PAS domain S-box-containing protein